jgi:hypothetical protein
MHLRHSQLVLPLALATSLSQAYPWKATDFMRIIEDAIVEHEPTQFFPVELMPHQVAVSDLICTGRVLSTNDGRSVEFAIDDLVWGTPPSTNITIKRIISNVSPIPTFRQDHRYLVFAFTNNWWTGKYAMEKGFINLYEYLSPTSRPPDLALYDEYRIMDDWESVIDFEWLDYNGTNFWEATRTFITNFNNLARVRQDPQGAMNLVYETLTNREARMRMPGVVLSKLRKYKYFHYEGGNNYNVELKKKAHPEWKLPDDAWKFYKWLHDDGATPCTTNACPTP